ncbi:MAG: TrkA family potassium uptake protein [Clostridia bacterium]|nr:TrkA family potassium uptake protein [Clostridia bacterium]
MAKSFLVIGLGRFGSSTAITLSKLGNEVMAVDRQMSYVNAIKDQVMNVAQCDMTNETVVKSMGVNEFDAVIIAVGSDIRASVLTTVLCAEHGAKHIICKAQDELHAKLLQKVGATKVVLPEHAAGERLAKSLDMESVLDFLNLSENHSINEMMVPESWIGKTLGGVNVRKNYEVSVFAIRRNNELMISLSAETEFCAGDIIVVVGENKRLERIAKL